MSDLVEIARIKGPHGLKGRLRILSLSGSSEHFKHYTHLIIGLTGSPLRLLSVEQRKGGAIVALEGLTHISQVEHLAGEVLYVRRDQLPEPGEDEFYWRDILGLRVMDTQGNEWGEVVRIFSTGSNDVLEVNRDKRHLIPVTKDVVREISLEGGRIVIDASLLEEILD